MALPRSDAQRAGQYNAKVDPSTVALKVAAQLPQMRSSFETFANDFVAMQELVNAECGTQADVFPIAYGAYQAYAAELWRLKKTGNGAVVAATAQIITDKWETRGCKNALLVLIALNVFSITVV